MGWDGCQPGGNREPAAGHERLAWPPGDYLFKLVADGGQRYMPLTVRDDASRAALVIQNDVTTWQAYNLWGGYDLYKGPEGSAATRSRVVSYDRPYDPAGEGAGDFLGNEYPLVRLVEALGLDVTYWTDLDLHEHPERLLAHRALVSLGHDEYWSTRMRRGAEAARDHGVNLAFLGANAVFRHIRLQPSPLGPDREEVNYKPWSARDDPAWRTDPAQVTTDWREPPCAIRRAGSSATSTSATLSTRPGSWSTWRPGCSPGPEWGSARRCRGWSGQSTTGSRPERPGRPGLSCCSTRRSAAAGGPALPMQLTTPPRAGLACSTVAPAPGCANSKRAAPAAAARR